MQVGLKPVPSLLFNNLRPAGNKLIYGHRDKVRIKAQSSSTPMHDVYELPTWLFDLHITALHY